MTKPSRIAVIGAGVAGSAAALALTRLGAEITVHEAYPDPAGPVGSFLSLAANGLNCLDALGNDVTATVTAAGFDVPLQRMWAARGTCLGQVARNRRATDPRPSTTVRRADLVDALRKAATAAGAVIDTGSRVTDPEHLRALTREADLVVGADGMWSVTRTLLDPAALAPRYARVYSLSGTAAVPTTGIDPEPGVFNMVFSRGGAFIHLTAPDGIIWWNAQVSDPIEPGPEQLARTTPADLAAIFHDSRQAAAILADAAIETRTLTHVLPATPRRHDERTVLIGDAVHPVGAGQGASMALEDAIVLTRQLAQAPSVPDAVAAFDHARQQRLKKMTVSARRNRDAKTMGPIQARVRDVVMPLVFPRAYPAATNWLYDFDPGTLPGGADPR
jgi:2-polyprenyl-6-methoxyphenol hydroxylase-like FAD-dependent oxidoreductase